MAMGESSECGLPADQPDTADTETNPETTEASPENTPKKKKKKKKDKIKEEESEGEVMPSCQQQSVTTPELNGTTHEANGNEVGDKKKKKKKKEKRLKAEVEEEEEGELCPVHGSDSSGYVSDKPSKKRKHETGSEGTSGFSELPEPPKSKKRKNKIEQLRIWKQIVFCLEIGCEKNLLILIMLMPVEYNDVPYSEQDFSSMLGSSKLL